MDMTKALKRINERMAVYQRQGLTDSAYYKKMVDKIKLLDVPYSESKGRFKISMKKSDIAKMDADTIAMLDSMPSLKQERKQAKEQGYKTTKEQNEYISNKGQLETWASDNLKEVYKDARSGLESAIILEGLFEDGLRKVNYDKVFGCINRYEREREDFHKEIHNSDFYREDIFDE